jgi:ribonuclease-3
LFEMALTHASYCQEDPSFPLASNERLEFLGDAVIGLVVAAELYVRQAGADEGRLTQIRSNLISSAALAPIARKLGLGECLRMGRGEASGGGRERKSNLGAALEAVVGAVLLDQGYEVAREFTLRLLEGTMESLLAHGVLRNPKAQLQELTQEEGLGLPKYRVAKALGRGHQWMFTISVEVGGDVLGQGEGRSKADAEQAAAREALAKLARHRPA